MRDQFWPYYRPTDADFKKLWTQGLVVPDANILLSLYRISAGTQAEVLKVFRAFGDRALMPHQVGEEFHRNRLKVISESVSPYKKVNAFVRDLERKVQEVCDGMRKDSAVDKTALLETVIARARAIEEDVNRLEHEHEIRLPAALAGDTVLEALHEIFAGRVTQPYSADVFAELADEAARRYADRVPPGYSDALKKDDGGIGDFMLWRQTLDVAKAQAIPFIVVTDDQKEDWYERFEGLVIGPRRELRMEAQEFAGVQMYAYTLEQFLRVAGDYQDNQVSQDAIDEISALSPRERMPIIIDRYRDQLDAELGRAEARRSDLEKAILSTEKAERDAEERYERLRSVRGAETPEFMALRRRAELLQMQREQLENSLELPAAPDEDLSELEILLDRVSTELGEIASQMDAQSQVPRQLLRHRSQLRKKKADQYAKLTSVEVDIARIADDLASVPRGATYEFYAE